ncbi:secretory carrier membrane protein 2, like isoform X3 [Electrophorus electricus]|uniref:secretory carrier membrane protein 2, like isoform X3 n=1 Tax=Electrophorus electricus TaxID=8005 RepID=UPI0015CF8515|nr:secretory carrier membrane protein 2, like isoform X3 [Electrophorus electricus]
MSGFDSNPFVEPVDVNPFQDPSVTRVTNTGMEGTDDFNPFSARALNNLNETTIPAPNASQPAVLQPTVEPSLRATAAAAQAELHKQQAELEKRAAELQRKEEELQNRDTAMGKQNNWPPLPRFCPIKPCFYQDFSEEIPLEYQRVCKMMYYLWMYHCVTLFLNLLACLAFFTVDTQNGVDFGLSILWFVLFSPGAFVCWYRPVYKAFSVPEVSGCNLHLRRRVFETGRTAPSASSFSSSSSPSKWWCTSFRALASPSGETVVGSPQSL